MNRPSLSNIPVAILNWVKLGLLGAAIIAGFFVWKSCTRDDPVPVRPSQVQVPEEGKPISRSVSERTAPSGMHGGVLHVTIKDTVKKEDVGKVKEREVTVYLPNDPQEDSPVYVNGGGDVGVSVSMSYSFVEDPTFDLKPHILVGGSVDGSGNVSPFLGATFLTGFKTVRLGGGLDKMAFGPFVSWEFYRFLNVSLKYQVVRFKDDYPKWALQLSYNLW